jgi:hypothetical protein
MMSKMKNSFGFVFLIPENPRYKKSDYLEHSLKHRFLDPGEGSNTHKFFQSRNLLFWTFWTILNGLTKIPSKNRAGKVSLHRQTHTHFLFKEYNSHSFYVRGLKKKVGPINFYRIFFINENFTQKASFYKVVPKITTNNLVKHYFV